MNPTSSTALTDEPLSRTGDPISSYTAAEKLHRSGRARTQRQQVLECLRRYGPQTGAELGVKMHGDRYAGHRRLCELERAGLVERAGFRKCNVTRQKCQVWRAILIQHDLFGNPIRRGS